MKAKYKIGQFVKYTETSGAQYGEVTAVVTRAKGYEYEIDNSNPFVEESDVISAYRAVTTRAVRTTKKRNVGFKTKNATQETHASN